MIYERSTIPVLPLFKVKVSIGIGLLVAHSLRVRFNTEYLRIGLVRKIWTHIQL